ncbi:DUF2470 domain-containing protein [Streptomyces alkaliphilus]|uniref:DUF2470 domain-containing protein n=1 Tax=Streptomyces alkaliphilus TaxID=1472722 RepID=A0A7W3TG96_9ACTN|nr:DUF2470 domain-containing protein [Streptomyces alkaliphilus]MBB0246277.1 DUF2470 domain-containing protein [Streptomyces alkaliphilus]
MTDSSASARLVIPGPTSDEGGHSRSEIRAVDTDGTVFLLVEGNSTAASATARRSDGTLTCVMEITDVAPVAVPHRIRGRGWVAGWLRVPSTEEAVRASRLTTGSRPDRGTGTPGETTAGEHGGPTALVLEVGEAYTDDLWGAEHVDAEEFRAARTDPLARHEAELLQHLAGAHHEQLLGLCRLLDPATAEWARRGRIAPLALDRFGLRVRFWSGRCPGGRPNGFDARFDFPRPVRDVTDLRCAMRRLFDAG